MRKEAAQELVDDLRTVRVQRPDRATNKVVCSYIDPIQLQVVCRQLWSMLPADTTVISRADVAALGKVDQALANYYAEQVRAAAERTAVPERTIREWFEERLITPQGLRGQVLEGTGGTGHQLLAELRDAHLVRAETLQGTTRYELANDRLIEPIRRDNAASRAHERYSFARAAELWEEEGKADHLLLLGADLAAAEQDDFVRAGTLTHRQREFLETSRRANELVRIATLLPGSTRLRIRVVVAALFLVVASLLGILAAWALRSVLGVC